MRLLHKSLVVDSLTLLLFISATFCSVLAYFSLSPFYVELFIKYTGQRNSVQVPQVSKTWLTTPIIKTLLSLNYVRFLLWMRVIKLEGECIEDFHHSENVRQNRLGNVTEKIRFTIISHWVRP